MFGFLDTYILKGKTPVRCDDLMRWGRWMEVADRVVAKADVDHYRVSTVFLGINHQWHPDGTPLLFETMVFDASHEWEDMDGVKHKGASVGEFMNRYSTWDEAEKGHNAAVSTPKRRHLKLVK